MKLSSKGVVFILSASFFVASCGDGSSQNNLYYNNYTHADTEGFEFLKTVATEAHFQQFASGAIGDAALGNEIKSVYAEIVQELHTLSDQQNVLSPQVAEYATDRISVQELAHSQEVIVGQFERVLQNTNTEIAEYAKKTLPKVEKLLAQTKAAK